MRNFVVVVHAAARRREIRSFEMDADHAGHALGDRCVDRGDRFAHHVDVVADQRRQETRRAEAAVRFADAADRLDCRRVVEQHAAAAVDLAIDEAGQQQIAAEILDVEIGHAAIVRGDDRVDHAGVDEHGDVVAETIRGQHARVDERRGHQTVSVTLLRCGGASGSRPRRTASAFTAS